MRTLPPARIPASALGCALAVLAACGGSADPVTERAARAARGDGDVVIGAAWPWEAHRDVLYWQGIEMAAADLNAAGGVLGRRLRVVRADDEESVDRGRLVAQEFARNPDVTAVIGHLQSYVTIPAAAIYDLSGVVLVAATATSPELTSKGYPRVFRTIFNDAEVGRQMARLGVARGHRRFVIYYSRDEYGRGLANAFEEEAISRGADVVNRQSYDPNLTANPLSAEQTVAGWSTLEFDAVFIAGQDRQAALLAKRLRQQGIRAAILGSDALATPTFVQSGGDAVEGTVIATPFHRDDPDPRVRSFARAFRARYGSDPDVGAALGYDAVRVLAHAMTEARTTDPAKVAAAMHALHDWPGVTGRFSFDRSGNLVGMPIHTVVVRHGRFEYLGDTTTRADTAR